MVHHSTQLFGWHKDSNVLSAFASDLDHGGRSRLYDRIYNDALDVGFTLVSHKTGTEVLCYLDKIERDKEGDVVAYHFKAVNSKKYTWTVTVWND